MLMSTLGAKNEDLSMKLLDSLRKYVRWAIPCSKYMRYSYFDRAVLV